MAKFLAAARNPAVPSRPERREFQSPAQGGDLLVSTPEIFGVFDVNQAVAAAMSVAHLYGPLTVHSVSAVLDRLFPETFMDGFAAVLEDQAQLPDPYRIQGSTQLFFEEGTLWVSGLAAAEALSRAPLLETVELLIRPFDEEETAPQGWLNFLHACPQAVVKRLQPGRTIRWRAIAVAGNEWNF